MRVNIWRKKTLGNILKKYLAHVQVARSITTRNKQASLKTCWTSFVTEFFFKWYLNPSRRVGTPQCLALRYQVIAKDDTLVEYIKTSLVLEKSQHRALTDWATNSHCCGVANIVYTSVYKSDRLRWWYMLKCRKQTPKSPFVIFKN